jgi:hypothetical protein
MLADSVEAEVVNHEHDAVLHNDVADAHARVRVQGADQVTRFAFWGPELALHDVEQVFFFDAVGYLAEQYVGFAEVCGVKQAVAVFLNEFVTHAEVTVEVILHVPDFGVARAQHRVDVRSIVEALVGCRRSVHLTSVHVFLRCVYHVVRICSYERTVKHKLRIIVSPVPSHGISDFIHLFIMFIPLFISAASPIVEDHSTLAIMQ